MKNRNIIKKALLLLLLLVAVCAHTPQSHAAIYDHVAAFVDNQAITKSEFEEQYSATQKVSPQVTAEEVITTMINRILLLNEAKKYRLEGAGREEIVREYINLKVRAFIRVPDASVEDFYKVNAGQFAGREYEDVREEIENYLTEKTLNERLKEILRELRKNAYIKVQME